MTRRALDELDELGRGGLIELEVAVRPRSWYEDRHRRAGVEAKEALGTAQLSEQLAEAVRRLAEAERRGVREAERAEIVDVEVAERLDREVVERLVVLHAASEDPARLHDQGKSPCPGNFSGSSGRQCMSIRGRHRWIGMCIYSCGSTG
jgi:hypothetical protein